MTPTILINGRELPLHVRPNTRATRLCLRLNPAGEGLLVTSPPHVSEGQLRAFVIERSHWIERQLRARPEHVPFVPGAVIPYLGTPHEIRLVPDIRRSVVADEKYLYVSGSEADLSKRLTGWLKARAKAAFTDRTHAHAATLGVSFAGVSVRDTRSRWGSCASSGRLSFSWRLIMAPEQALDYVAAHEVAHLVEFNHSPRFWKLVGSLVGDYSAPRKWLKTEGRSLHHYG